jgi:hypothetical protein
MLTPRTFTLAVMAAALTATAIAIARRHRSETDVSISHLQTEQPAARSTDVNAQSVYLPDRFPDEERSAPIEPLPPQF